jgi:hypothetical protein
MIPTISGTPSPTPTPMPIFAPSLNPPALDFALGEAPALVVVVADVEPVLVPLPVAVPLSDATIERYWL